MKLNREEALKKFWIKFKNESKPTFGNFIKYQPKLVKCSYILSPIITTLSLLLFGIDSLVSGLYLSIILFNILLYVRFRRDWRYSRKYFNWDLIEKT